MLAVAIDQDWENSQDWQSQSYWLAVSVLTRDSEMDTQSRAGGTPCRVSGQVSAPTLC